MTVTTIWIHARDLEVAAAEDGLMPLAYPKPQRIVLDRVAAKTKRDRLSQAFRQHVWLRDGGRCRHCDRVVLRTLECVPNQGHVHHRRGRNVAPEDRFNVEEAVLLCLMCHGDPDVIALFRRTP